MGKAMCAAVIGVAIFLCAWDARATCFLPPWVIVGVRGSNETQVDDPSGMGTTVGAAYRAARARMVALGVSTSTIFGWPIDYPAIPVEGWKAKNFITGAYAESVRQGTVALGEYLEASATACPNTRFIVIGYSQGAQVVHQYLLSTPPRNVMDGIRALLLIADPIGWVGTYQHGLSPTTGGDVGMLGSGGSANRALLPPGLYDRSLVVCFTSDGICNNPYPLLSPAADVYLYSHTDVHKTYWSCCTSGHPVAEDWGIQIGRLALGLTIQASPATGAVVDHGNIVRMFVRGTDAHDHEKYLPADASAWHPFTAGVAPSGTTVASDPTAVVDHGGTIRVFVRGADRKLYVRTHTSAGWDDWVSLGGIINGRPRAIVDSKNVVRVYVRTSNNTVDEISLTPGQAWSGYYGMGLVSGFDPVPIVDSFDTVRLYAVDGFPQLRERSLPLNGVWSGWATLGYLHIEDTPMPLVDQKGVVRVYVRDGGAHLFEIYLARHAAWSQFWEISEDEGGFIAETGAPAVPFVDSEGTIRLYSGSTDGTLRERHLDRSAGVPWSSWISVGTGVKFPVGATEELDGVVYVFTHGLTNLLGIDTLNTRWSGVINQTGETLP